MREDSGAALNASRDNSRTDYLLHAYHVAFKCEQLCFMARGIATGRRAGLSGVGSTQQRTPGCCVRQLAKQHTNRHAWSSPPPLQRESTQLLQAHAAPPSAPAHPRSHPARTE